MKRIFIPKVGSKVKLKLWDHYQMLDQQTIEHCQLVQRTHNEVACALRMGELTEEQAKELEAKVVAELRAQYAEYCKAHDVPTMWAWFEVLAASERTCRLRHTSRAVNAPDPAWEGDVPTEQIDPPLGWQPTYEILCKDQAQADKIVNEWFARGINVWTNHDMSSAGCGGKAFTPADSEGSAGWRYTGEPTETIAPEDCAKIFTVKIYEEWEPSIPENKVDRKAEIERLRKSGVTVEYLKRHRMWLATRETLVYQPME